MPRPALLLALALAPLIVSAQEKTAPGDKVSPARQELLDPFLGAAGECLALAKAVPEEKYTWRPMEEVRSFGEVFVHMAGSTLLFCSYAGMKAPAGPAHDLAAIYMKRGFEMPEIFAAERAIKTKAQTVEIMDQAFHLAREMVRQMPDSDLEKRVDFFGRNITERALLIRLGDHLSEHLGQAIAYARISHIVPPWSLKKD
ncbi:MAG TPA: DinB family protein [Bryobacteraceae bacterium]|nr:DinB family protein [Bryobacteraceae bacterium]